MKSLEIFSGAGGLAKGFELAGFEHAAFVEFNKQACASLQANFDAKKVYCGDIRHYDFSSLGEVDVVAGGPPCQPFSLGGKHQANHDDRDMFPFAIRAIETLAPRAFVFENVKGLLRASFAEYFEYITLRLAYPEFGMEQGVDWHKHLDALRKIRYENYSGIKYQVSFKLLNAADFGVPQQRERVVIVGIRSDVGASWTFPDVTHSEERLLWDKYVTGTYWVKHGVPMSQQPAMDAMLASRIEKLKQRFGMFEPESKPWVTVRDALANIPCPKLVRDMPDHFFRDGARVYPGHTGSDYDEPAKTIKAGGHGVPGGENMIRFSDGSVRYFTVLEAKRIQTFPDDFRVQGAWGEAMRQIGNAVPVLLAWKIGSHLHFLLQQTQKIKQRESDVFAQSLVSPQRKSATISANF